jgi:hypothetical protein
MRHHDEGQCAEVPMAGLWEAADKDPIPSYPLGAAGFLMAIARTQSRHLLSAPSKFVCLVLWGYPERSKC